MKKWVSVLLFLWICSPVMELCCKVGGNALNRGDEQSKTRKSLRRLDTNGLYDDESNAANVPSSQ